MRYLRKFNEGFEDEIDDFHSELDEVIYDKEKLFNFLEESGFTKEEKVVNPHGQDIEVVVFTLDHIQIILPKTDDLEERHYASVRHALIMNGIIDDKVEFDQIFENLIDDKDSEIDKHIQNDTATPVEKFDVHFAMAKIKEKYSQEDVTNMFDNEWPNWVDDNWQDDDCDSEYDWYMDHSNEEAEDAVITEMINWYCKEYNGGISLALNPHCELFDAIKSEYDCL